MCWRSTKLDKQIATKNIKVFKVGYVINGKLISYYRSYSYDFNQLYETDINPIRWPGGHYILNGFHSYDRKKCKCKKDKKTYTWDIYTFCSSSPYSRIIPLASYSDENSIVECIIPKGSEYYENEKGEIISNQIIIKNLIPINRLCRM